MPPGDDGFLRLAQSTPPPPDPWYLVQALAAWTLGAAAIGGILFLLSACIRCL